MGCIRYDREDCYDERGKAQDEVKSFFARHPAIGMPIDAEMARHSDRQAIPYQPKTNCGYRQRQPH